MRFLAIRCIVNPLTEMEEMEDKETIRLDKWLWAARFFKTRSMATQAVNGGKVRLNGNRTKPAHDVKVGDRLVIGIGPVEFHVTVLGLAKFRRPAAEARLLYEEEPESVKVREEQREQRRLSGAGFAAPTKKPDKRDRRKILSFTRKMNRE
jgi:ribosome-associated heat shock protein Hsp15